MINDDFTHGQTMDIMIMDNIWKDGIFEDSWPWPYSVMYILDSDVKHLIFTCDLNQNQELTLFQ